LRLRVPGRSKRRIKYTPKIADLGLVKVLEESHGVEGIVALEGSLRGSKAFDGLEGATATGRTGSLLYMAPEVYSLPGDASKHTYNEKADIFSFGLIMFELFKRQPRSALLACPDEAETMAGETAHGRRPRLPWRWPAPLRALIAECWAEAPAQRPAATEIVARLTEMKPLIVERMDRTGIYRWADGKIPPAGVDK
jgi:serine/threonine protein kinase